MFDKVLGKKHLKYVFMILIAFQMYPSGNKLDVETEEATIDFINEEFSADGGVTFVYPNVDPEKTAKIKAFKLKKMTDKNLVLASDGVIFEQGESKVEAEEMYFNLDNQNLKIRNGISYVKVEDAPVPNDKIYYGGEEFMAQYPNEAHVKNAWFTTSKKALELKNFEDEPADVLPYHLKAKKISIYPGKKIVAHNVFVYAGKVPILWFPWYASSLKAGTSAPLFPVVGADSTSGSYVLWGFDYGYDSDYFNGSAAAKLTSKKGLYIGQWDNIYKVNGDKNNTGKISLTDALVLPKGDYEKEYKLEYSHTYKGQYGTVNFKYTNQTINTINDVIDALEKYNSGVNTGNAYSGLETKISRYELSTNLAGMGKDKDMSLKADVQYADNKQFLQTLLAELNDKISSDTETDNDIKSSIDFKKDNFLYGINVKYNYLDDLDPGSQKADTTSFVDDVTLDLNLKKYGISFYTQEKTWDTWVLLDDDERYYGGKYLNAVDGWAKGLNYVPFTVKKYDMYLRENKITLGNYKLFNGKLTYSLEFYEKEEEKELNMTEDPFRSPSTTYTDRQKQYFRDEDITYKKTESSYTKLSLNQGNFSLGLKLGEEEEKYIDRTLDDDGITYTNTSDYYDTELRNKAIDLKKGGKLDLTIGQRFDNFERGDELINVYVKGIHDINLYDNSGNYLRMMDLSLKNNLSVSYNKYSFDKANYDFTSSNGITNVNDEEDLRIYRLTSRKNSLGLKNNATLGVGNTSSTYGLAIKKDYNSLYTDWLQNDEMVNSIDFKIDDKRTVYVSYGTDKDYGKNDRDTNSGISNILAEKYFLEQKTDTFNLTLADDKKEYSWTRTKSVDDERENAYVNKNGGDLSNITRTYGDIDTTEKKNTDTISYGYKLDDKKSYKLGYTRGYSSVYDYDKSKYTSEGIKNKVSVEYVNKDLFTLSFSLQDYKDNVSSINDEKRFILKYDYKKSNLPKIGNEANVQLVDSTGTERLSLTEAELAAIDKKYNEEKRKEQGLGFDLMGLGTEQEEVIYKQYYSLTVDGTRNEDYFNASNDFVASLESLDVTLEAHYKRFKLKYVFDQNFTFTKNSSYNYGIKKTKTTKEHEFSALTMIGKDSKSWKLKGEFEINEMKSGDNGYLDTWALSVGKEFDFFSATLKYKQEWNTTYSGYDWTWSINFALLTFPEKGINVGAKSEGGSLSPDISAGM